jgi:hypothetical protein
VITDDEVMRLFERADPARFDDAAPVVDVAGDLDALRTRSIDMTLIDIDRPPTEPTKPRRWPIITAAAAAVVLIVGGVLVLAAGDDADDDTTVAAETTAEEVARGFLDAYAAYDADRALTYLADDALGEIVGEAETPATPEAFRLVLAADEAMGYKQTITDCEQRGETASGVSVRCAYDYHNLGSDQLGLGPYSGSYWDLTVRDGRIVSAESHISIGTNSASRQTWEPFNNWVTTLYPEDAAVMYGNARHTYGRVSEEAIRLWEQHVQEYVTTRNAFVARADSICTAAKARLDEQLRAAGLETRDDDGLEYERAAAPILDEALAELRAVPAPEAFRAEFDHGYSLVEQLAQALHGTATGTAATMDQIAQAGLGLFDCTFALQR